MAWKGVALYRGSFPLGSLDGKENMKNKKHCMELFAKGMLLLILAQAVESGYAKDSFNALMDSANATMDAMRETREQNEAPDNIRAIFAKAKEEKENNDGINFCGFYVGMTSSDAKALAEWYNLKAEEWSVDGEPVYAVNLTLKGIRRVMKGGDTFDELAQGVANRVGDLKSRGGWGEPETYERKTIDGLVVTVSEQNGFQLFSEKAKEEAPGAYPGATKTIKLPGGATMDMVWCPPGSFYMGGRGGVTLTKGFWLAKTEVTQAQWKSVMRNNPSSHNEWDDTLPVECVTWPECQEFCQKAGLQLPTEAQWEYACRAGSTGGPAGDLDYLAWYSDNSSQTHPVAQKKPNAWGLYDMHGNVYEWCADWYGNYPSTNEPDPEGPSTGKYRVRRGGCYSSEKGHCTFDHRWFENPYDRSRICGFRPAFSVKAKGGGGLQENLSSTGGDDAAQKVQPMTVTNKTPRFDKIDVEAARTMALRPMWKVGENAVTEMNSVFGIEFGKPFSRASDPPELSERSGWLYAIPLESVCYDFKFCLVHETVKSRKVHMIQIGTRNMAWSAELEHKCQDTYERMVRLLERMTGRQFDPEKQDGTSKSRELSFGTAGIQVNRMKIEGIDQVMVMFTRMDLYIQQVHESEN